MEIVDKIFPEEQLILYASKSSEDLHMIADTGCPNTMNDKDEIIKYIVIFYDRSANHVLALSIRTCMLD